MDYNSKNITHIVVDMLYDFIDGTLACKNALPAMGKTIEYINNNPNQRVLYVSDCHPENHCSFTQNGGTWPSHCVEGTHGQQIHNDFYTKIINECSRPNISNMFFKGEEQTAEQYSSFCATNSNMESLGEYIQKLSSTGCADIIVITGIATEFCIKESTMDFLNAGNNVHIATDCLAYVNYQGHTDALNLLNENGAVLI